MGIRSRLSHFYFPDILSKSRIQKIPSNCGIVLMYHEVLPDEVELPAWTVVKESYFRMQMDYLQGHFDVLSIDDAVDRINGKKIGKNPFAVITFDDGYKGNIDIVFPIMKSMGLPFAVYVATRAVLNNSLNWFDHVINLLCLHKDIFIDLFYNGKRESFKIHYRLPERLRWKKIQLLLSKLKMMPPIDRDNNVKLIYKKYAEYGSVLKMLNLNDLHKLSASHLVTIGAHTHGHELLNQLSQNDILKTLNLANSILMNICNYQPKHFSYPNGNYTKSVIEQIIKAGYKTAVTTIRGRWSPKTNLYEIPRLSIGRFDSKMQFKALISGYL